MVDTRLNSAGNLRIKFLPPTAFANPFWPTVAELNAGTSIEDALVWEDFAFGIQASETTSLPPVSAKSATDSRGQSNYGGTMRFPYPGTYNDNGNDLSRIYDLVRLPWTELMVVWAVDGLIGASGQPSSAMTFANGDYVSVARVKTDSWSDMTEGDDVMQYTVGLLKSGLLAPYSVASTTAPVLAVTPASATLTGNGSKAVLRATVNGREYTRGVVWTSSNPNAVTVSKGGVLTRVGSGAATITATLPRTTAAVTATATVAA